jgi:hypothetical protein
VEGVTISQSNFTGDGYGIFVPANDPVTVRNLGSGNRVGGGSSP